MAEKKSRFAGFVGPSYTDRVRRFDCQKLINMYLEIDETGAGKNGEPAVMIGTPGLKLLNTLGDGPIRGMHTLSNQQVSIIVSGNAVYQISSAAGTPVQLVGNLNTSYGYVSIADNGIQCIIVDGQFGYYYNIGSTNLIQIDDPNFYPADTVTYQDGYFILNQSGTTNFFISDLYSVDFLPLNQAAKSGNSDILVAVISCNRQLFLLGANTTEMWWDAGQSGSTPFQRQDGRFSQVGCAAPGSVQILSETFFWLGTNAQGGGVVYMLENSIPTRISNHAVEYYIQQYGNLQQATAWTYQMEGHYFYCLNIPGSNTTWCYDLANGQWHERQSTIGGVTGRNLAEAHCVLNNQHIVGDYTNGNYYLLDMNTFTDNGNMIRRIRQAPHIADDLYRIFYKMLEVDCSFGVGLPVAPDNPNSTYDPRATLYISDDGGQTFKNPIYGNLGMTGRYNNRLRFQRLGSGRDIVVRLEITAPVRVEVLGAVFSLEKGLA